MTDQTARFNSWFQIISNVAIIVGLGLVIYELNQSKQLAWAQFNQGNIQRLTSIRIAMMGEDPRKALAKAALHPADLNERDAVALDAYYQSIVMSWVKQRVRSRIADIDAPWRAVVAQSAAVNSAPSPAVGVSGPGLRKSMTVSA